MEERLFLELKSANHDNVGDAVYHKVQRGIDVIIF
jgi:hypothetical protein